MTYIKESLIHLNQKYKTQGEVLRAISKISVDEKIASEDIFYDLEKREREYSTAIGQSIAIPHAKTKKIIKPSIIIIRNEEDIIWGDEYIKLIIALLTSDTGGEEHLKLLSSLSRKLMHDSFREKLIRSKSKKEVLEILLSIGE